MHTKLLRLIFIPILFLASILPQPALAVSGLPNTATFGYGARVDMWGQDVYAAIELASQLGLDWLAIDVDWNRHWPTVETADFSSLDYVLQAARQRNLSVLLSLTNAPTWAINPNGPEPGITNALLQSILNIYSDVIKAVELFPGINSTSKWGTIPNPQAYLSMLQTVRQGCEAAGQQVHLVTTIEPLSAGTTDGSLDDLIFLESLYSLGGTPDMTIIGIRYPMVMGAPMSDPEASNPIVLRHYEAVRGLMLGHQHAGGMVWITGFSWPTTGTPNPAEPLTMPTTPAQQAQWINRALQLLRAQLFIGTAFFSSLNLNSATQNSPALLLPGGVLHPASVTISRFAGGGINSTTWTAPQASSGASPSMAATATPTSQPTYLRYEGKPRK